MRNFLNAPRGFLPRAQQPQRMRMYANTLKYGVPAISSYIAGRYSGKTVAPVPVVNVKKGSIRARPVRKSFPKKINKQIKELKRLTESDMGTLIYRACVVGAGGVSVNTSGTATALDVSVSNLETVLAQLRYYNPSVPGTLTTADGAAGTFQKDFLFNKLSMKVLFRNNYQIPCKVRIFVCQPKEDTSISPVTAFTNGLTDIGAPSSGAPNVYLTDSVQFSDLWKIVASKKAVLEPGREVTISHSVKPFHYDPSLVDSHSQSYQNRFASTVIIYRLEGVLSHDSAVSTEHGTSQARLDIRSDVTYEVRYSAGADIKYLVLVNDMDTPTNGFVCSNKPVADNQAYSVA